MSPFNKRFIRPSQTDNFSLFLKFVWGVTGFVLYSLYSMMLTDFDLYRQLRDLKTSEDLTEGSRACIKGKVNFFGGPKVGSIEETLEKAIEEELGVRDIVWYHTTFTHSEKRGKNSTTITDARISSFKPFTLKTSRGDVAIPSNPSRIFTIRRAKGVSVGSRFRAFSARSSKVDILYLNAGELYVIGTVGPMKNGFRTIVSDSTHPVIYSQVPLETLVSSLRYASIAAGFALAFFLATILIDFRPSLKAKFEEAPERYFVFELTSGSETLAIGLLIGFVIAWIVLFSGDPRGHSFDNDQRFALTAMFFFGLLYICRSVECFYVASKRENYFFYISRGFLFQSSERVAPLTKINPHVDRITGSKGAVSYVIRGTGNNGTIDLTDRFSRACDPDQIVSDYRAFLAAKEP